MDRAGIKAQNALGIRVTHLRQIAKKIGKNHELALQLWDSKIHEAMMLAAIIDEPKKVSSEQMEKWVADFYSWDICDNAISSCFRKTSFAWDKVNAWVISKPEYEKRAGFAMIAILAVHEKKEPNATWLQLFPTLKEGAKDPRNFVKKAVNWAIRQIGKRNLALNAATIIFCNELLDMEEKSAQWIAKDAIKELKSEAVLNRLRQND